MSTGYIRFSPGNNIDYKEKANHFYFLKQAFKELGDKITLAAFFNEVLSQISNY